ncbi:starch synthase [Chitinophaga skermanii]|uniref:Glycogen synthase n=1 Tax=Chitinophaga skermanii TaxID=331697 RepID=A0A327QXG2_9BACT|nr:glycogen/starch synthase [Chitinophaga skermanii]RAJ08414.1 starch synthase [Chitinophaga skermanii]
MEILHVSAECYPAAKVGGLADVVGALPKYQVHEGAISKVVIPAYRTKFFHEQHFEIVHQGGVWIGRDWYHFNVLKEEKNILGFDLYLIDIPGLLDQPNVYGYDNDVERFLGFQIAVLDWLNEWKHLPSIVHCHDHHTGLIPFLMQYGYKYSHLKQVPTILTIHNAQYQGQFGWDRVYLLPSFDLWKAGLLDWGGAINPLACAIKCAWRVNTVSPGYMRELLESANGLEGLLRMEQSKCSGILNGIDAEVWDPATDPYLPAHYEAAAFEEGKYANKVAICESYHLDPSLPLFVFIGRLVKDKGADVLPEIIYRASQDHPGAANFLVLGSGDSEITYHLSQLQHSVANNYRFYQGYNEALSHQLYAAADFLLMPSRVEPCGLNQMYALRYGTIPMVRRTGGLQDTVVDFGDEGGFGIRFEHASAWDVGYAIRRALVLYQDQHQINQLRSRVMQIDHSWNTAAHHYINLYTSLK